MAIKYKKFKQCPYCILCRYEGFFMAQHILTKHPEKVEEWVKGEKQ